MTERTAKAVNTRLKRLSATFEEENGRQPTVEELNDLYKEELREQQRKSRLNYKGTGGFASLSPERLREVSSKGGKKSKRPPARKG